MSNNFQALVLEQEDRQTLAEVRELSIEDLPDRQMLVRVHYSTLNYKDALAVTGKGRVIRKFPIIPGIDLAGEVVDAGDSSFHAGDKVISTGWGMGEEYWGGLGQYARLDSAWPLAFAQRRKGPVRTPAPQRLALTRKPERLWRSLACGARRGAQVIKEIFGWRHNHPRIPRCQTSPVCLE